MKEINPYKMDGEHLVHKPRSQGITCRIGYDCDGHCQCFCRRIATDGFEDLFTQPETKTCLVCCGTYAKGAMCGTCFK